MPDEPDSRPDDTPESDEPAVDPPTALVREQMSRLADAIAALRHDLTQPGPEGTADGLPVGYEERLGLLLGRRLADVEAAVQVAMALAERTGVELREELELVTQRIAAELDVVSGIARAASVTRSKTHDDYALEARFDEVHRRIDAVTRELRSGVASLEQQRTGLRPPYGERLEATLGRRIETVEGAVEVASAQAERIGEEVREELGAVAASAESRTTELARSLANLGERIETLEGGTTTPDGVSFADAWRNGLSELVARIEEIEREREAVAAQLVYNAEAWRSERIALQERVAELAARIVTGPAEIDDAELWPSGRAFDQMRIAVEGLRMRLAYHEKTVAELVGSRGVDERLDELNRLLRRLEGAERTVRGERDTVLEQLESIATRMDTRLQQLEA